MKKLSYTAFYFIFLGVFVLLVGCSASKRADLVDRMYKPYTPSNIYTESYLPDTLSRVAVLPISSQDVEGLNMQNMEDIFYGELGKSSRLEVVEVSRENLYYEFGVFEVRSTDPLPCNFLKKIQNQTGAEAIMFIDFTFYHPYRPVALGVRAKLLDIASGRVLWAFDEIFDSGDRQVANGARIYQDSNIRLGYPLDTGASVLKSPLVFSKYVAYEAFRTLPRR